MHYAGSKSEVFQTSRLGGFKLNNEQYGVGDSHSAVLTSTGAIWGWGTFRDAGGVYSFQPGVRIALLPMLIHQPSSNEDKVIKIVSGAPVASNFYALVFRACQANLFSATVNSIALS